jgi:uncharacterized protein
MLPAPSPLPPPAPVSAAERLPLLDVLRGFALYGVLLANLVPWFSGRAFLPREEVLAATSRADNVTLFLMGVLVNGKFQTLLSLLFGLGFSMQLARAEARGGSGVALYVRRLGAMFALGCCHVIALWWGDVLWGYALAAIFLLPFRKRSTRALLLWAAFFTLVPRLVTMVPAVAALIDAWRPHAHDYPAFKAQVLAAFRGHDYGLLARMQAEHALAFSAPIVAWYFPWLLGRFLLGYAAGRSGRILDAAAHLPFFRRLLAWGAGIGLVISVLIVVERLLQRRGMLVPLAAEMALTVPQEIGVLALVCAYVAAIVLLMQRPAWRRGLLLLAPAGRMPLTTYFSQSLICAFLFYGWGLGWIGRVSATLCVPLSLAIFAVQLFLSRRWLQHFRFGPVEWVWRSLSYGRAQPMRPDAS